MWAPIIRNVLLPAQERAFGRPTLRLYRELRAAPPATARDVVAWQRARLVDLLGHAREHIPYWRERLAGCDLSSGADLRSLLDAVPVLTRTEISRERERMLWRGAPGRVLLHRSSGTTDDNLKFYFDGQRQAWDRALRMRTLAEYGVLPGDSLLQFSPVPNYWDPVNRLKEPLRRFRDWVRRGTPFDLRPLDTARLDAGLDLLERYSPVCVVSYPSWMVALANRAARLGRSVRPQGLRVILCVGEMLYDFQRATIERAFGGRVVEEFGSHDSGLIAAEAPEGGWRVNWQHVCVEVLRGGRPAMAGEKGELVVTNLYSRVMPFVRYATGDVVDAPVSAAAAGFHDATMPRVDGRTSDVLVAADGSLVGNRALVEELVSTLHSADFSLFQPAAGMLVCMVTRGSGWSERRDEVESVLHRHLGEQRVQWMVGDAFRMLKSGKHRYVCSTAAHGLLAHDLRAGTSLARAWPQRLVGIS